ncbi:MAG: hypothetical protein D6812_14130, partial [Deltaproteobacteria bacterium]
MSVRGSQHRDVRWIFPLQDITTNRSVERVSLPPNNHSLMAGVDALLGGAPRVSTGFIQAHMLGKDLSASTDHDASAVCREIHSFNIIVDNDEYAFGFVWAYQTTKANTTEAKVYADYWIVNKTNGGVSSFTMVPVLQDPIGFYDRMDVVGWGRFVYVLFEDRDPVMFTLDSSGSLTLYDP